MSFAEKLLNWYSENGRELPWRATCDAYTIWLSEVILQQTRVEQGLPYFYKFVEELPTIEAFASADEATILRLWQGLGYYSRARNMHKAAKKVMEDFEGKFPSAYEDLLLLPGVGEYTAAAISSFAANEQRAVVDGNVFRVLSRYLGIDTPINSAAGKKLFTQYACDLLSKEQPSLYNQAIMDFGAIVCKPKAPLCESCVFRLDCRAYAEGLVDVLPQKNKGKASRNRYFNYFIVERDAEVILVKRTEGDIWANLFEFPLIETKEPISPDKLVGLEEFQCNFGKAQLVPVGKTIKHILSHQNIFANFYRVLFPSSEVEKKANWDYYNSEFLDKLAKHKLIYTFIDKYLRN